MHSIPIKSGVVLLLYDGNLRQIPRNLNFWNIRNKMKLIAARHVILSSLTLLRRDLM